MEVSSSPRPICGWIASALLLAFGRLADAAPMYSATDLGSATWVYAGTAGDGAFYITDTENHHPLSITFPVSVTPYVSSGDPSSLPYAYADQGSVYTIRTKYTMRVFAENAQGTVIGGLPNSDHSYNPMSELKLGYAQLQPDGTFGPFQPIFPGAVPANANLTNAYTNLYLNAKNQILVASPGLSEYGKIFSDGEIIDLNAHTTTPLDSMIPASLLAKYRYFNALGFADNGSIVATAYLTTSLSSGYGDERVLLLSLPVPEPTTFVIFTGGLGAIAFARRFRRQSQIYG